jgi:hypothetical protein
MYPRTEACIRNKASFDSGPQCHSPRTPAPALRLMFPHAQSQLKRSTLRVNRGARRVPWRVEGGRWRECGGVCGQARSNLALQGEGERETNRSGFHSRTRNPGLSHRIYRTTSFRPKCWRFDPFHINADLPICTSVAYSIPPSSLA